MRNNHIWSISWCKPNFSKPWSYLTESSVQNIGLESSLKPSFTHRNWVQRELVFNNSGRKLYTYTPKTLRSFDAYNLKNYSEYFSYHNKHRKNIKKEYSFIQDVVVNQFHDDTLYFSLCPEEIAVYDTNRSEISAHIYCDISRWNENNDCLLEASKHNSNIVYFTTKTSGMRYVKRVDLRTYIKKLIFCFTNETQDSFFLNSPNDESKFVVIEGLKVLFFDTKGQTSNINLKPYKVFQAKAESGFEQIASLKFNSDGSELLVKMNLGSIFILNTTTFESEAVLDGEKFSKVDFMGNNSDYIVAMKKFEGENIVIYSRKSKKIVNILEQQCTGSTNKQGSFATSPTNCLIAVNTAVNYSNGNYFPIVNIFSPLGNVRTVHYL